MKRILLAVAALSVTLLAGCATVPMASPEADTRAKSFATVPTKANIYIYRNESFGGAIKMTVSMNGKVLGQTGPRSYLFAQVDPGKYEIASLTENTSTITIDAQPDKNYFVWQEVKMGAWSARSQLLLMDEASGRKGVEECTLAVTTP